MSRERRTLLIFVICLAMLCVVGALAVRAQTEDSGAWVFNAGNQGCATATSCVITYTSEAVDTDNYHSTVANTNRLVAPWYGFYAISSHINATASAAGTTRLLALRDQNAAVLAISQVQQNTHSAVNLHLTVSAVVYMSPGDWVESYFYQDSGSTLTINALAKYSPEFRIAYIGFEFPTPQTFPTLDLTVLATLLPTDTPRPTNTLVPTDTAVPTDTPVPTHTPGWYIPTLTPIPTDTPGGASADPDPYHTIVTQTLTSGNQWAFDRSADAGEIIIGALLSVLLIITGFAKMARWI